MFFRKECSLYRIFYRKIHFLHFQKYEVECNLLNYTCIMQVGFPIPKHLLNKAKVKQVDKNTFLAENAFYRQTYTK